MVEKGSTRHCFGEVPHDIHMLLTGYSGLRLPQPVGDAAR